MAASEPSAITTQKAAGVSGAQDRHRCGGGRQEGDDHGSMSRRYGSEGIGRQQRKADDDAARHERQAQPGAGRGQPLAGDGKCCDGEGSGHDGPAGTDEQRRDACHGHAGERNGEGEGRHAEQAPPDSRGLTRR
jgi:hypothetical protein